MPEGELLLSGVQHDPGPEAIAEPVGEVAQPAEVLGSDSLGSLDFDADHGASRVLQHHVDFHLIAVAVMEKLHGLFSPSELSRDLANREVLQQRPNVGSRILGSVLSHTAEPPAEAGVGDDQLRRRYRTRGQVG